MRGEKGRKNLCVIILLLFCFVEAGWMQGASWEAYFLPGLFLEKTKELEKQIGEDAFYFLDDVWQGVKSLIIIPEAEAKSKRSFYNDDMLPVFHSSFYSVGGGTYWPVDDIGKGTVSFFENDTVKKEAKDTEKIKIKEMLGEAYRYLLFGERGQMLFVVSRNKVGEEEGELVYVPEELRGYEENIEEIEENEEESREKFIEEEEKIENFIKVAEAIEELLEAGYFEEGTVFVGGGSCFVEQEKEGSYVSSNKTIEKYYRGGDIDFVVKGEYIGEEFNHGPPLMGLVLERNYQPKLTQSKPRILPLIFTEGEKERFLYKMVGGKIGYIFIEEKELSAEEKSWLIKDIIEEDGKLLAIINCALKIEKEDFSKIKPESMKEEELRKITKRYGKEELTKVEIRSKEELKELVRDIKIGIARSPIEIYQEDKFGEGEFSKFVRIVEEAEKKGAVEERKGVAEQEEKSLREEKDEGKRWGKKNDIVRKRIGDKIIKIIKNNEVEKKEEMVSLEKEEEKEEKIVLIGNAGEKGENEEIVEVKEVEEEKIEGKEFSLVKEDRDMTGLREKVFIEVSKLMEKERKENNEIKTGRGIIEEKIDDTVEENDTVEGREKRRREGREVVLGREKEGREIRGPPQEKRELSLPIDPDQTSPARVIIEVNNDNKKVRWEKERIERVAFYISLLTGQNLASVINEVSTCAVDGEVRVGGIEEILEKYGFSGKDVMGDLVLVEGNSKVKREVVVEEEKGVNKKEKKEEKEEKEESKGREKVEEENNINNIGKNKDKEEKERKEEGKDKSKGKNKEERKGGSASSLVMIGNRGVKEEVNCASYALSEMLGVDEEIVAIQLSIYTINGQTSMYGMKEVASLYGKELEGRRIEKGKIERIRGAFIAHLDLGRGKGHYVLVTKVDKDRVVCIDNGEVREMKKEEFERLWTGYVLVEKGEQIGRELVKAEMEEVKGSYRVEREYDQWRNLRGEKIYDEEGNLLEERRYNLSGKMIEKKVYNKRGELIEHKKWEYRDNQIQLKAEKIYGEDGEIIEARYYTNKGDFYKEVEYEGGEASKITIYNPNTGFKGMEIFIEDGVIRKRVLWLDGLKLAEIFYDEKGEMTKQLRYDAAGDVREEWVVVDLGGGSKKIFVLDKQRKVRKILYYQGEKVLKKEKYEPYFEGVERGKKIGEWIYTYNEEEKVATVVFEGFKENEEGEKIWVKEYWTYIYDEKGEGYKIEVKDEEGNLIREESYEYYDYAKSKEEEDEADKEIKGMLDFVRKVANLLLFNKDENGDEDEEGRITEKVIYDPETGEVEERSIYRYKKLQKGYYPEYEYEKIYEMIVVDGEGNLVERKVYAYNTNSPLLVSRIYDWRYEGGELYEQEVQIYNEYEKLVESIVKDKDGNLKERIEYTYIKTDEFNSLLKEMKTTTYDPYTKKIKEEVINTYDKYGYLEKVEVKDGEGRLKEEKTYSYQDIDNYAITKRQVEEKIRILKEVEIKKYEGGVLKERQVLKYEEGLLKEMYVYSDKGNLMEKRVYSYDERNYLKEVAYYNKGTELYMKEIYNEHEFLVERLMYENGGYRGKWIYSWDERKGRLEHIDVFNNAGNKVREIEYEYTEGGYIKRTKDYTTQQTREEEYTVEEKRWEEDKELLARKTIYQSGTKVYEETHSYTKDERGRIVEEIVYKKRWGDENVSGEWKEVHTYTYDDHDKLVKEGVVTYAREEEGEGWKQIKRETTEYYYNTAGTLYRKVIKEYDNNGSLVRTETQEIMEGGDRIKTTVTDKDGTTVSEKWVVEEDAVKKVWKGEKTSRSRKEEITITEYKIAAWRIDGMSMIVEKKITEGNLTGTETGIYYYDGRAVITGQLSSEEGGDRWSKTKRVTWTVTITSWGERRVTGTSTQIEERSLGDDEHGSSYYSRRQDTWTKIYDLAGTLRYEKETTDIYAKHETWSESKKSSFYSCSTYTEYRYIERKRDIFGTLRYEYENWWEGSRSWGYRERETEKGSKRTEWKSESEASGGHHYEWDENGVKIVNERWQERSSRGWMKVTIEYNEEISRKIDPEGEGPVTVTHHYSWENDTFKGTEIYINGELFYTSDDYAVLEVTENAITMTNEKGEVVELVGEGTLVIEESEVEMEGGEIKNIKFKGATFYSKGLTDVIGKIYFYDEMRVIDMYLKEDLSLPSRLEVEQEVFLNKDKYPSLVWAYENVWKDEAGNSVLKGEIIIGITEEGEMLYGFKPSEEGIEEVIEAVRSIQQEEIKLMVDSKKNWKAVVDDRGLINCVVDEEGNKVYQYFYEENGLLSYMLNWEESKLERYFYAEDAFGFPIVYAKAEIKGVTGICEAEEVKVEDRGAVVEIEEMVGVLEKIGEEVSAAEKGEIEKIIKELREFQEEEVERQEEGVEKVVDWLSGWLDEKKGELDEKVINRVKGVIELLEDMSDFQLKEEKIGGVIEEMIELLEEVNEEGELDEGIELLKNIEFSERKEEKIKEAIEGLEAMIGERKEEEEEVEKVNVVGLLEEVVELEKEELRREREKIWKEKQWAEIESWESAGKEVVVNNEGIINYVVDKEKGVVYQYLYSKGEGAVSYTVVEIKEGEEGYYGNVEVKNIREGEVKYFSMEKVGKEFPLTETVFEYLANVIKMCPALNKTVEEGRDRRRLVEEMFIQYFLGKAGAGMNILGGVERFLSERGVETVVEEKGIDIRGIVQAVIGGLSKEKIRNMWAALTVLLNLREEVEKGAEGSKYNKCVSIDEEGCCCYCWKVVTLNVGGQEIEIKYETAKEIVSEAAEILKNFEEGNLSINEETYTQLENLINKIKGAYRQMIAEEAYVRKSGTFNFIEEIGPIEGMEDKLTALIEWIEQWWISGMGERLATFCPVSEEVSIDLGGVGGDVIGQQQMMRNITASVDSLEEFEEQAQDWDWDKGENNLKKEDMLKKGEEPKSEPEKKEGEGRGEEPSTGEVPGEALDTSFPSELPPEDPSSGSTPPVLEPKQDIIGY